MATSKKSATDGEHQDQKQLLASQWASKLAQARERDTRETRELPLTSRVPPSRALFFLAVQTIVFGTVDKMEQKWTYINMKNGKGCPAN